MLVNADVSATGYIIDLVGVFVNILDRNIIVHKKIHITHPRGLSITMVNLGTYIAALAKQGAPDRHSIRPWRRTLGSIFASQLASYSKPINGMRHKQPYPKKTKYGTCSERNIGVTWTSSFRSSSIRTAIG